MSHSDFPIGEYEERIKRIQRKLYEKGLDALILTSAETINYATGYACSWTVCLGEFSCAIVFKDSEPALLVRSLESKSVKRHWMRDCSAYDDWRGPWSHLKDTLQKHKASQGRIGVEENTLTLRKLESLRQAVPGAELFGAADIVPDLMCTPSPLEIEFTKRSARIAQAGFDRAIGMVREGMPFNRIITEARQAMYSAGMTEQQMAEGNYILCAVWGGVDGGRLHETDVTGQVEAGDLVTIELWGTHKHYFSGAMGTVYVGMEPPSTIVDTYAVISDMYLRTREALAPGARSSEVWENANKPYKASYGVDYFRMIGFRQGAALTGRLDRGTDVMKPGMTYIVQPEVTDPLFICVCATLMITETGCEELTKPLLELVRV
ncbi:M24 family metallopeptidase [Chloroflexota bacterium]